MEEEDELEEEIDIIYSGELDKELVLMQFPLVPAENYKSNSIISLSINRENQILKLEKKIDINYLDQRSPNLTTKQIMNGQRIDPNTNLLFGIFRNNALYLNPISDVYQFRHDFSSLEDESDLSSLAKKDKKTFRSGNTNQVKEKSENTFTPLQLYYPGSISSSEIMEKFISEGNNNLKEKIDFLSKEEYFNLLMKYINDKSITDELNMKAIPPDADEPQKKQKQKPKTQEEINVIPMEIEEECIKAIPEKKNENVVINCIVNAFGKDDCINYQSLFNTLCNNLNIGNNDERLKDIESEIENNCFVINKDQPNATCFLKDVGDGIIREVRRNLIEFIMESDGVKKQQIKMFLKEKNLVIQDNQLSKILKSICEYSKWLWVIKKAKQKK